MKRVKTANKTQPVGRVTTLDQRAEYLTGLRVQQFSHGTISREEECFGKKATLGQKFSFTKWI